MIKTYKEGYGPVYLELHDRHVFWEVKNPNLTDEFIDEAVDHAIWNLELLYKNLKVFCLGRSGRHVCIEDTPINRRRYHAVRQKAERITDRLVEKLNKYKQED